MKIYGRLILTSLLVLSFNIQAQNVQPQDKILPIIEVPPVGTGGSSGGLATVFSNIWILNPEEFKKNEIEFLLKDGTRVGGLFFPRKFKKSAPLLIGTFGFLSDRWSAPTGQFIKNYVLENRIDAHILILDHPTSAPFLFYNGNLSPGGYDEAQMLLEVTGQFLEQNRVDVSTLHLIGVSMGANSVWHTLREDKRLGTNYFSSAVTFSGVIDLNRVPRRQLTLYDSNLWGETERGFGWYEQLIGTKFLLTHFSDAYEYMSGQKLDFDEINPGTFFYEKYQDRIDHLKRMKSKLDPKISFRNLNDYLKSQLLTRTIKDIEKPIYMVHSIDDPAVQFDQFESMIIRAQLSPYVTTQTVKDGGHWGYTWTYGKDWMSAVVNSIFGSDRL